MRKEDYYYCIQDDMAIEDKDTYIDDDRFIRCMKCHRRVYVMTDHEE